MGLFFFWFNLSFFAINFLSHLTRCSNSFLCHVKILSRFTRIPIVTAAIDALLLLWKKSAHLVTKEHPKNSFNSFLNHCIVQYFVYTNSIYSEFSSGDGFVFNCSSYIFYNISSNILPYLSHVFFQLIFGVNSFSRSHITSPTFKAGSFVCTDLNESTAH